MKSVFLITVIIFIGFGCQNSRRISKNESARISVNKENPFYWQYKDKPTVLLGGTWQDNLFNHPVGLAEHLDKLLSVGGNYVRNTMSHRNVGSFRQKHGEEKFLELLPKIQLFGILFQDISFEFFADFKLMQEKTCAGFGSAIPTYGQEPVELGKVLFDNGHFWYYVWSRDPDYKKPLTSKDVNGHGPMSEIYDDGGEGDTPSFLYLLSGVFGLNDPNDPTQGSWGSMFMPMGESFPENYFATCNVAQNELIRWVPDATNSFINRLLWSVKEPGEVNREPVAVLNGDKSNRMLTLSGKPGEKIQLDASRSFDPDGDQISFNWFWYSKADTYTGDFVIKNPGLALQTITMPSDLGNHDLHIVLEVRDNGTPDLVSYRRVTIKSKPI